MTSSEYFLSARPTFPWSLSGIGLPLFVAFATVLIGLTLWAYLRHPQSTGRRIGIVMVLRILALVVALLTALRPSLGIQEDPKLPSHLLIGIDRSETMSVKDEVNSSTRLDAVKQALEKWQPILDELKNDQNVTTTIYGFGPSEFRESSSLWTNETPADAKRSDYGAYLNRTRERWRTERFVRGHLVIGDGADNGTAFNAVTEAGRWRGAAPLHTVGVGRTDSLSSARDVAVSSIACEPEPVPIKTDLTVKANIAQIGFPGATVKAVLSLDAGDGFKQVSVVPVKLEKSSGNEVLFKIKAPDKAGEVKVKVEVPVDQIPGDVAPANNARQTYLTVTKEGIRVLYIDRWRTEMTRIKDALQADKRIDITRVLRQDDRPAGFGEKADFDFDTKAYDVIILGNISKRQLAAIDPNLTAKIAEQVIKKGTGLLMLGGEATFAGTDGRPYADGWRGTPIADILPVELDRMPPAARIADQPNARFQVVPTFDGLGHYLMRVGDTPQQTAELWQKLNDSQSFARMTGISKLGDPKPTAQILAYASADRALTPPGQRTYQLPILLAVQQIGDGNRGRVAAFAGQDTLVWEALGLTESKQGTTLHRRFWRQMILWLAHQEVDEGAAYARPLYRELPVGSEQTVKVGLRGPGGAEIKNAKFTVKVIAPGQTPDSAASTPAVADPAGGCKSSFAPNQPGEYTVTVSAEGKDATGAAVKGEASARFFAYPEASDEMLRPAADFEYLKSLAAAGGGQFYRLDDIPQLLRDLKSQPPDSARPKPRFLPDWRRNLSKGFLPAWLVIFVLLLAAEWGLRRLWGMV